MFMIYLKIGKIPTKTCKFYDEVYKTLYSGHDAIKGYVERKYYTNFTRLELAKAISEFCYITISRQDSSFTEDQIFEIIEECCINQLNEKERYYIQYYNSVCPNGYNQTLGGYSSVSQKLQLDQIEDITHLLQTTKLTNREIANFYGVSENTICGINTGYY